MKEVLKVNETEIIGHGAIAKALEGIDKPFTFFASGVANSHEIDESQYRREKNLLLGQVYPSLLHSKRLVYFSSLCTLTDPERRYSKHKVEMENIVRTEFPKYSIVRLGNPEWATNPHQLIPFFKEKIARGEPFDIYDEYRHYLTLDEFRYWINLIPEDRNSELMITGERMKVKDIVERIKNGN